MIQVQTRPAVRCPNCRKKLAEWVEGDAEFVCEDCNAVVRIEDGYVYCLSVS